MKIVKWLATILACLMTVVLMWSLIAITPIFMINEWRVVETLYTLSIPPWERPFNHILFPDPEGAYYNSPVYADVALTGEYPPSPRALFTLLYGTPDPSLSPEALKHWRNLYYVGSLRTNDPPEMPIVIHHSSMFPSWAQVLCLNNQTYVTNDSHFVRMLITEPWTLVKDKFENGEEYEAFTNRTRISKVTEGLK